MILISNVSFYIKSKSGSFLATQNLCCIAIFCIQNACAFCEKLPQTKLQIKTILKPKLKQCNLLIL